MFFYLLQSGGGEKKKKETILNQDMGKYLEKRVRVKFRGGREGEWVDTCTAIDVRSYHLQLSTE